MSAKDLIETLKKRDANAVISFIDSVFEKIEGAGDDTALQEMLGMMVSGTLPALIWERTDSKAKTSATPITPETLRQLFSFANVNRLANLPGMPDAIRENLLEYLTQLPSYDMSLFTPAGKIEEGREKEAEKCAQEHEKMADMFFRGLEA